MQRQRSHQLARSDAHQRGQPLALRSGVGERLRLGVVDHLQAMLERAVMLVGRAERRRGLRVDSAARPQGLERVERAGRAQERPAAAEDRLLRLHEKLDLADAAKPGLDVPAARIVLGRVGAAPLANAGGELRDLLGHVEVEGAPPDEGLDLGKEVVRRHGIAGDGPGLDEGEPLP